VLPLISRYALDGGAAELGFLTAALGLGALLSALVIAGNKRAGRTTMFVGGAIFAALLGGVAISDWFYVTMHFYCW